MIQAKMRVKLDYDQTEIWKIITNNSNYAWRSDVKRIEIINDKEFLEYDKNNFETHFTITCFEPCHRYEFDIKNKNMEGHWIGVLTTEDEGCALDFTEMIEVKNKIMKLMAKAYLKKQQQNYINDLKMKLEDK